MVHVLSGVWPSPEEAVKVDPDDQNKLIPVSEFDRRANNIELIKSNHALLPLIRQCLSNGPALRPSSEEVLQQVSTAAEKHTPSFVNRLELLKRVGTLQESYRSAVDKNVQLCKEIGSVRSENEDLTSQLESYQSSSLTESVSHVAEMEILRGELSESTSQVDHWQKLYHLKEVQLSDVELSHQGEVDLLRQQMSEDRTAAEEEYRSNMDATLRRHKIEKTALEAEIEKLKLDCSDRRQQQAITSRKMELEGVERKYQRQLEAKTAELDLKESVLVTKTKTIDNLRDQLKQVHAATQGLANAANKQVSVL